MSEKQEGSCCSVCKSGCPIGGSGWKWSLFTLAVLIVAGVATSTVFAGSEKGSCPMSGAKATCAASTAQPAGAAAAQGAAGEKEKAACDKDKKACCAGKDKQCDKQASADKAACDKDKKCCEKGKDAKPEEKEKK